MDIQAYHALQDRYESLDKTPASALSNDDRLSLDFYRAETAYRRTGDIDEVHAPVKVRKWLLNVTLLDEFDARHGLAPHKQPRPLRDVIDEEENRLAEWASHRRDTWDTLCSYQRERLLCIPSFEPDPRGRKWDDQVARYKLVVGRIGHAPVVTSNDEDERMSARWASRVRAQWHRGLLAQHRVNDVAGLKFWHWKV